MNEALSFDADYIAERQAGLLDEIAEDDANFGRLLMFGALELAKQSLAATGRAPRVDLSVKVSVVPVRRKAVFGAGAKEGETTECTEATWHLGIVTIKKSRHKTETK
jgi:hypothetical protein